MATVEELTQAQRRVGQTAELNAAKPVADKTVPGGLSQPQTVTPMQAPALQQTTPQADATPATTAAPVAAQAPAAEQNPVTSQNSAQAQAIEQMYAAQREAQLRQLEASYNQSLSDAQAAQAKIDPLYQGKANDLAVQYERNRRNYNQQAVGNGINTGTASQAALAMNSNYQRDYGALRTAQANAQAEADRGMANLQAQYQNAVSNAIAQNDYQKASALYQEYNNQYTRDSQQAALLAQYGDFSGWEKLIGKEQADNMAAVWRIQNPDLAYQLGQMSANEYFRVKGQYPVGYNPAAGGGYGGYSWPGGYTPGGTDTSLTGGGDDDETADKVTDDGEKPLPRRSAADAASIAENGRGRNGISGVDPRQFQMDADAAYQAMGGRMNLQGAARYADDLEKIYGPEYAASVYDKAVQMANSTKARAEKTAQREQEKGMNRTDYYSSGAFGLTRARAENRNEERRRKEAEEERLREQYQQALREQYND